MKCSLAGMEFLKKRSNVLDGEIKELTTEIKELFVKLEGQEDQDGAKARRIAENINELKEEKKELILQRKQLLDKLPPVGAPPKD
jgi:predicted  nucleic acid-binding Zn-ribbon protein